MRKEVLTVEEIAIVLEIGRTKAYNLVKMKLFPVLKIGNAYRIPKKGFYEWLHQQAS